MNGHIICMYVCMHACLRDQQFKCMNKAMYVYCLYGVRDIIYTYMGIRCVCKYVLLTLYVYVCSEVLSFLSVRFLLRGFTGQL